MSVLDFAFGVVVGFAAGATLGFSWFMRQQEAHFKALMEQIRCKP